ncbi:MAG: DNA photolyase family protein [Actinomycetota bacterium]|nr:DNA photolyase family protein [Actinomycetota bacterium]
MAAGVSIMWFRRDLRVRDHPALVAAAAHERCVPAFVFDPRLLTTGRFPSAIRTQFMLGCLAELATALRERGGKLVVRFGRPEEEIPRLCAEVGASDLYFTADVAPWARGRDRRVVDALDGVRAHPLPGACVVEDPAAIRTQTGAPYTVFSPFARTWRTVPRRAVLNAPPEVCTPANVKAGELPSLEELGLPEPPSRGTFAPGEEAARRQATAFLRSGLEQYADRRDAPKGGSSRLSPYLRWGCLSALKLDVRVAELSGPGPEDYRTELAWRDFYAAVLLHFPHVTRLEFVERMRELEWADPAEHLDAWTEGRTGYPLVDAGMRQLAHEGWMHNRVRMVVGSFLTKDLHLDWREGERVFMERLLDGDMAANNGGWQWIASTGTDPKPYFQRLFNPVTQHEKFDPDGEYVRRWCPELARVGPEKLSEPWTMSPEEQEAAGCRIGDDYPAPIVDHAQERRRAVERYRAVAEE